MSAKQPRMLSLPAAAGHAHAGVLLVLSLAYFIYLGRAGYSTGVQWLAGALLLAGELLAQPGGGPRYQGRRFGEVERRHAALLSSVRDQAGGQDD